MRSTLFYIPHELAGWPLFGFGWVLLALVLGCAAWIAWLVYRTNKIQPKQKSDRWQALQSELTNGLPVWAIAIGLVIFILPSIEQQLPTSPPIILGLPIRGYGVMVLIGLLCGIGIAIRRGRQLGLSTDLIVGLGFWMMMGGVLGARTFYVFQKWEEFSDRQFADRIIAIVKLTEGGLVIYGGIFGGIIACAIYCRWHKLATRAVADLVAPSFLIGLAFGRIGCLLNGCCFGGICTSNLPTIQFPSGSGPYLVQLESGRLLGIETSPTNQEIVKQVSEGSWAEKEGVQEGAKITDIEVLPLKPDPNHPTEAEFGVRLKVNDQTKVVSPTALPSQSLPLHPSQIYAAINALLLAWLIWQLQPVVRRDGQAFLVAFLLYGLSRFLLEGIRSDEGSQLGTGLTIAQLIAVVSFVVATLLVLSTRSTSPRAWDWSRA